MDKKHQLFNLAGLAKRAGKTITGEELVTKAIQNGRVKLIFLANDAASNLTKKMIDKSKFYEVVVCQTFSESELSQAIGQHRKVVGIADDGFVKKMESLMTE